MVCAIEASLLTGRIARVSTFLGKTCLESSWGYFRVRAASRGIGRQDGYEMAVNE